MIMVKKDTPLLVLGMHIDEQDRYALLCGRCGGICITTVNCYGPNIDDPGSFTTLWGAILVTDLQSLIWGEDFNCALQEQVDRSPSSVEARSVAALWIRAIMPEHRLLDIWRHRHTQKREGTFYSVVHDMWSRLDYWLVTPDVGPWVKEI